MLSVKTFLVVVFSGPVFFHRKLHKKIFHPHSHLVQLGRTKFFFTGMESQVIFTIIQPPESFSDENNKTLQSSGLLLLLLLFFIIDTVTDNIKHKDYVRSDFCIFCVLDDIVQKSIQPPLGLAVEVRK